MEATREIYWNVGPAVLLPMYLLTAAAMALAGFWFWKRVRVYRQGQSLDRSADLKQRVLSALNMAIMQMRVRRGGGAGGAHALFFWSFLVLLVGTLLILVQADLTDPLFGVRFLEGPFYLIFSLLLDLGGLVALLMLIALMVRRYLIRPEGLVSRRDDLAVHGLLFSILVTGFFIEALRMAATELPLNRELAIWSPVGMAMAIPLQSLAEPQLRSLHQVFWWIHMLLVMGFIAIIPLTRLRHILTTSLNYVFVDRGPKGALRTLDLEDESAEHFGAEKIADLSWKDIFDTDACTQCKRCQDQCPAHATEKPLSPMKLINDLGQVAFDDPEAALCERVGTDALWSCTTCRACQEVCPASIEHVGKIVEMRRNLVLMQGEFPGEEVTAAAENLEVNGNPLGLSFSARADWAKDLDLVVAGQGGEFDILYFVGCYASFDKRNIKVARSFVELCKAAGVRVGILGEAEKCCGEPMRKMGNEYLYQMMAAENIEAMQASGATKVVTSCPHCFNSLAKDYRDLGFELEVQHYSEYLAELLEQGRLKLQPQAFDCTYHDSCYLGRYNDIYQAPRELLAAAGGRIEEMERHGSESFCCGAGGGRILAEEKLGSRISEHRARMAAQTQAPTLVSNCPFCLTMFEDGVKGAQLEESLVPRDLAEILAERIDRP